MEIYRFYDTDIYGNEEYDIFGKDYENLLKTCCECSSVLSLKFSNKNISYYDELEQYKIKSETHNIEILKSIVKQEEIVYYKTSPELCELLLKITDSIFKWIDGWGFKNPEDPCFYREDGSAFLTSVIHEGVVKLMPRDEEDVSRIVSNPLWILESNDIRKMY